MTGGASPYRKGAAFEREVLKLYHEHEWVATRTPQSRNPYDIIALKDGKAHLVQAKLNGRLSKTDKALLFEVAFRVPAIPVLAHKHEGKVALVNLFDGEAVDDLGS